MLVVLLVGDQNLQRIFYVLRKDNHLYHHPFWDDDAEWSSDALAGVQQSKAGGVVALRSPLSFDTGDTFRIDTCEVHALLDRLSTTKRCLFDATQFLSERDLEMIQSLVV